MRREQRDRGVARAARWRGAARSTSTSLSQSWLLLVVALERVERLGVGRIDREDACVEARGLAGVLQLGAGDAGGAAQRVEPALVVAGQRRRASRRP